MVWMLPIVEYRGKRWFVDERLKQIRNVLNPREYVDFLGLPLSLEE